MCRLLATNEADMLYRLPEPETAGKLRDVAMVFGLVAMGIVASAGAIWIIWQIGGVMP
jgi:hypothetical protein